MEPTPLSVFVILVSTMIPTNFRTVFQSALTDCICNVRANASQDSSGQTLGCQSAVPTAATLVWVTEALLLATPPSSLAAIFGEQFPFGFLPLQRRQAASGVSCGRHSCMLALKRVDWTWTH